jgi:cell division protease FtsH
LKNPEKYTNLGGKIQGALLVGPPGTLLAKLSLVKQVPFSLYQDLILLKCL